MITLYHTEGCHLCEQAQRILEQCNISFQAKDIIEDEELVASFGTRIPVLAKQSGECLDWPFDHDTIQAFLSSSSK